MPRQAKLSKKNGHWYTKAGNPNGVYFGRVGDVNYQDAKEKFADHLKALVPAPRFFVRHCCHAFF